jgi:hypothetical protein
VLAPGEAQTVFDSLQSDLAAGEITLVSGDAAVRLEFHAIVDQCHAQQPPIFIRTNDALHLAAARCVGETEIVATDNQLSEFCQSLFAAPFWKNPPSGTGAGSVQIFLHADGFNDWVLVAEGK